MASSGRFDSRSFLRTLAVAALFGAVAWAGVTLTRGDGRIAAVWLANAIALAYLLRSARSVVVVALPVFAIADFLANLLIGDAPSRSLGLACANTVEIAVAWYGLHLCGLGRPRMEKVRDLFLFCLIAGLAAPAISGIVATATLGASDGPALAHLWLDWTVTDGLGMILLCPTLLIFSDALRDARRPTAREAIEWGLILVIGTAAVLAIFLQSRFPVLFLAGPIVLIHAFRLGMAGTAFSVVKIAVIASLFTSLGTGPIGMIDAPLGTKLVLLQVFLVVCFGMGLPVAALLAGRNRLVAELSASERKLSLIANNVHDVVTAYDLTGACVYASPSSREVFGLEPEELVARRDDFPQIHPDDVGRLRAVLGDLLAGVRERDVVLYRRFDDDARTVFRWFEAVGGLVRDTDGSPREVVASVRDVTARKRLEEDLVAARLDAENAAAAKSSFLANMSHEIRTPMNGVLGFAQLLLEEDLAPEQKRHAELIFDSGRAMMRLLNDILDISKIEAGQMEVAAEPTDLAHLLQGCVKLVSPSVERKGIVLRLDVSSDLPRRICADPLRMRQIVLNLLGNAAKFTEWGAIRVEARRRAVSGSEWLTIAVEDTGIGIAPERLAHIFFPFEQADASTSRRFGGSGLGLSISRQLAELMDGRLTVESTPGRGSRFELAIPLVAAEAVSTAAPANDDRGLPQRARTGAHVLLVEDHDVNQLLGRTMLERAGFRVTCAGDGQEAVDMVRAALTDEQRFDIVLMDIQMPILDGYAATRAIRAAGVTPTELPILAVTANAFAEDIANALDAGMQGHVVKPLVFADLQREMTRLIPERRSQAVTIPAQSEPPDVAALWLRRREEALHAAAAVAQSESLAGEERDRIAMLMHKLAGTAGLFGEDELGRLALQLERRLRGDVDGEEPRALAERLLAAA